MSKWFKIPMAILFIFCFTLTGCHNNSDFQNGQSKEKPTKIELPIELPKEDTENKQQTASEPSEEATLSFNNWKYECQQDFYAKQIKEGKTDISTNTIIFFNDYYEKNPIEIRSLPVFSYEKSPDWNDLTKFIYERALYREGDTSITKEHFDETVKKYFENIQYTHKSSSFLTYKDGKYMPTGWDEDGSFIYELTKLEKENTTEGQDKWKAHITGYYFSELDGDPNESMQSQNAQAVWKEMQKEEYIGLNYWQARKRLMLNNPRSVLDPACEWIVEFLVNDPMGDVYFTYLSCERKEL